MGHTSINIISILKCIRYSNYVICISTGGIGSTSAVNSLTFAGINICVFETKPCSRGLIFAVRSGLVSYLVDKLCLWGIYFCDLKMVA